MTEAALAQIGPLLEILRANPALSEIRPMVFHLSGRDFVHFHAYADVVVADVRLAKGVVRMPVSSAERQAELLDRIEECLSSVEARARNRERRGGSRCATR
jgi:hypothetical protein